MKIIFSRKGYDTTNGGFPSPVFPDGTCYSLPIPGKYNDKTYADLEFVYNGDPIQKICNDLTNFRIKINGKTKHCDYFDSKFRCHQDPCLIDDYFVLGQRGSALGHLVKKQIKQGDIFLFYGLFQKVKKDKGKWIYKEKPFHLIYAALKIEHIIFFPEQDITKYPFLKAHPHFDKNFLKKYPKNGFFFGKNFRFFKFLRNRVLTDIEHYKGVSFWKLPINFDFAKYISFIKKVEIRDDKYSCLSHWGYGQEFVLNTEKMTEIEKKSIYDFIGSIYLDT